MKKIDVKGLNKKQIIAICVIAVLVIALATIGTMIVFQVFNGKISEIILDKPKGICLSPFKTVSGEVIEEMVKLANLFPYIDFHRYLQNLT